MAMRSLGYMPSEVELAIIMQRLDMDGETWAGSISRGFGGVGRGCRTSLDSSARSWVSGALHSESKDLGFAS